MNQGEEENTIKADFTTRPYARAKLAQLYYPGLNPVFILQKLYHWMRKNVALTRTLSEVNYSECRHSFLKREVGLIVHYLRGP